MRKITILFLTILIISTNISYGSEGEHWVYNELADFKQQVLKYKENLTREEWESIKYNVFNSDKLDDTINTHDWAILVKMILNPDNGKSEHMMEAYIYNLASSNTITREAAVGGFVKLLTKDYIDGSVTAEEIEPSKALEDLKEISEMQRVLVQIAYIEEILDSQTVTHFRPTDNLTNAEAVSMLHRVITKYIAETQQKYSNDQHWSFYKIKSYAKIMNAKGSELALIDKMAQTYEMLDKPIVVEDWHMLLSFTLGLDNNEDSNKFYTIGLSEDGFITRDRAVAGMMKLFDQAGFEDARDASEEERIITSQSFIDFDKAFDKSKLSLAFSEGLIKGYSDGSFRPEKHLTNGEALALLQAVAEKYIEIK